MVVAKNQVSGRELSSTYQSFSDTAPTYSYLDLSRARSDESLLWSASDEAAVLVAELRASLHPSATVEVADVDNSVALPAEEHPNIVILDHKQLSISQRSLHMPPPRSKSFTNLTSTASSTEDVNQLSVAGNDVSSLNNRNSHFVKEYSRFSLRPRRKNGSSSGSAEGFPPHSPSRPKQETLRSFGSLRSLLKLGGMSNRAKSGPVAKKVMPPTVPDGGGSCSSSSCSSVSSSHRHSGSSLSSGVFSSTTDQRASFTSSLGEESNPPPSPRSPGRDSGCDHGMLGSITSSGSTCSSISSNTTNGGTTRMTSTGSANANANTASPSHYQNNQFTFPPNHQVPQFAHLMCPKASPGSPHHMPADTNYSYMQYQQQSSMEDQGIDVQSPGRSSPGSGSGSSTSGSTSSSGNCRNSTTSLDSGRASSSTHTGPHAHRLSGQSYDSGSILRHSYHSSSSSLGSTETDVGAHTNVHELIKNGVPDSEVLRVWLCELHFDEYYDKFLSAGYDMPTISRMTPEDLNAIGITKPAHRKKLKAEISRLNISDGLPDYIPSRLEEWLQLLRLDNYISSLKQQNYNTVEQVTQITWEDLEDVGITKLGHQKKVMLAIKRVKDIKLGKKFSCQSIPYSTGVDNSDTYMALNEMRAYTNNQFRLEQLSRLPTDSNGHFVPHGYPVPPPFRYPQGVYSQDRQSAVLNPTLHYRPDLVAVNVRNQGRGGPRTSQEPIYGTYQTFVPEYRFPPNHLSLPPRPMIPLQNGPQRSLEDGDVTPTNEVNCYEGGGTLPRPRTANKYRPVAKVTAKTRADIHDIPKFAKEQDDKKVNLIPQGSASTNNTPQGTPKKKLPPPPPRRSNSISESSKDSSLARTKPLPAYDFKNNLQPDMTPNMPPPPPAPQDSGNHQHLMGDFPPPPPPLTCITLAKRTSNLSGSSSSSDATPYNSDSEIVGFRSRRNDSNASFKSNSSTDSGESLPFANDNAGTIKQRATRPHGVGFPLLVSSPRSSPHSSPALRRKEGIVHPTIRQPPSLNTINNNHTNAPLAHPVKPTTVSSPEGTSDVLSDIGNMLANLTDELDAMLEQELAAKT